MALSGAVLGSLILTSLGCSSSGQQAGPATTTSPAPSSTTVRPSTTQPGTARETTTPAEPVQASSSYPALTDLYAQITASGVACGALVDDSAPSDNPYKIDVDLGFQQGRCATGPATALVFAIFDNSADRDDRATELVQTMGSISTPDDPAYILVGENWLINVGQHEDDLDLLVKQLGGQVRRAPEQ